MCNTMLKDSNYYNYPSTVELLNNGQVGSRRFVLYNNIVEVIFSQKFSLYWFKKLANSIKYSFTTMKHLCKPSVQKLVLLLLILAIIRSELA